MLFIYGTSQEPGPASPPPPRCTRHPGQAGRTRQPPSAAPEHTHTHTQHVLCERIDSPTLSITREDKKRPNLVL